MLSNLAAGLNTAKGLALAWDVTIATAAVLAGLGLVLTPWVAGFWRRYEREQAARIRADNQVVCALGQLAVTGFLAGQGRQQPLTGQG